MTHTWLPDDPSPAAWLLLCSAAFSPSSLSPLSLSSPTVASPSAAPLFDTQHLHSVHVSHFVSPSNLLPLISLYLRPITAN